MVEIRFRTSRTKTAVKTATCSRCRTDMILQQRDRQGRLLCPSCGWTLIPTEIVALTADSEGVKA